MEIVIKEEHIVFLTITTWVGTCVIGADHYYGRLRPLNGNQSFDVSYKLSKEDAKNLNRGIKPENVKSIGYKEGDESERFRSRKKLIAEAKKQFKKRFPKAKVLVLGDRGIIEPQEILVGPREFKSKINRLAKEYDKLDWDIDEDQPKIRKLEGEWQELWPEKYT